jgi:hypothetical protein
MAGPVLEEPHMKIPTMQDVWVSVWSMRAKQRIV